MMIQYVASILEAAIFASEEALSLSQLIKLFNPEEGVDKKILKQALEKLTQSYLNRAIELKEVASGYRFQVRADYNLWIRRLWQAKPPKYARATMETLALIAYKQPITRSEIEAVRGVRVSTPIMKTLEERAWIKVIGYRELPGKPALYATTKPFLDHFNLKSLAELPELTAIKEAEKFEASLMEQVQFDMAELERQPETSKSDLLKALAVEVPSEAV